MIEFFLGRRVLTNLITLAVVLVGAFAFFSIRREMIPDFSFNTVLIQAVYPGGSPQEVENLVTTPIEDEIRTVDGIEKVQSFSIEGISIIVVQMDQNLSEDEVDRGVMEIQQAINRTPNLPQEVDTPFVKELTADDPLIHLAIAGGSADARYTLAEDIEDTFKNVPGVSRVEFMGKLEPEIWVEPSTAKLSQYRISLGEIAEAIRARNVSVPGGTVTLGDKEFLVRTSGPLVTAEDVEDVVLRSTDAHDSVRIRDIARVTERFEKEKVITKVNTMPAIVVSPFKKKSGDALKLIDELEKVTATFENRAKAEGITLIQCWDQSFWINRRLNVMQSNMVQGGVLILICLFLFLDWRLALVAALGVPISFAAAIAGAWYMGMSLNLMSLMAFVVVLGMLDDDSVVVAENIYRHLEMGHPPHKAAILGAKEVAVPVLASVATVISAYLPFLLVGGIWAKFLSAFPTIVILCFMASLFECFFILPAHVLEIMHFGKPVEKKGGNRWYHWMADHYQSLLTWVLTNRYKFAGLVLIFLIFTGFLATWRLKFVLFPKGMIEQFYVRADFKQGTPLEETERRYSGVERILNAVPDNRLQAFITTTGQKKDEWQRERRGHHMVQSWVFLNPHNPSHAEKASGLFDELRNELKKQPDIDKYEILELGGGPPVGSPVHAQVRGTDLVVLKEIAERLKAKLRAVPGVSDVRDGLEGGKTEAILKVNESEAAYAGIDAARIANNVFLAIEGGETVRLRRGGDEVKVKVKLPEQALDAQGIDALRGLLVPNNRGQAVSLSSILSLSERQGPPFIEHYNYRRAVTVTANVDYKTITPGPANNVVRKTFEEIKNEYPGTDIVFGGEEEETQRSLSTFFRSFLVTLLIDFVILATVFSSYLQPFMIIGLTVPIGFVGVMYAMMLHGQPLSFMAIIGIVAMAGVVINNAIVLVDFINRERAAGKPALQACLDAGAVRFRPIWASSITTLIGLLPAAYGFGGQEPFVQPMALAMSWGLAFAMPMTLLLIPTAVLILDDIQTRLGNVGSRIATRISNAIFRSKHF